MDRKPENINSHTKRERICEGKLTSQQGLLLIFLNDSLQHLIKSFQKYIKSCVDKQLYKK